MKKSLCLNLVSVGLLMVMVAGCATTSREGIRVDADMFENQEVYGKGPVEDFILLGSYLYEHKDYMSLKKAAEQFLETRENSDLSCLYVENVLADICTYHVIDFDRALDLYERVEEGATRFPGDRHLAFDRQATKITKPTWGQKILCVGALAIGGWVDPSTWAEAGKWMSEQESGYRIKDLPFLKQYFSISVGEIRRVNLEREDYLESLLGD